MGALLGLTLGIGLFLVWSAFGPPRPPRVRAKPGLRDRTAEMLAQAGIDSVTPVALVGSCLGTGLVVLLAMLVVSRSPVVALAFAVMAAYSPLALVRYRQRRRQSDLREVWPEVVDNLASGVRAGLSLPEALAQVGVRGPEQVRAHFVRFGEDYRATGRFAQSLDRLKASLADPVGDRVVESLRLAREVGGSDLGRLLRTLSGFLREEARARAELQARQSWTVNGARLAVASPWLVLALLSLNPDGVEAYNSAAGALLLAGGGALCFVAYRLMLHIARLPEEERVLR
ncbi:type II secretion system F family protein [Motilibacter aurantiacus]|uniref:type II secretion system F family protein n=1 Tax=Motilibacter aurantiacus TaxID=2714955 RepID=UPI001409388F|nr:type II secretion system F family protein [Motilibacter aurantiacus]NHC45308.1 type II secretion system protein F [Motilibacter aurantiacus]